MNEHDVIAIDGPSGVGKSTVAKELANSLVDTGALYRTLAFLADKAQISWDSAKQIAELAQQHDFSFDPSGILFLDGSPIGDLIRTPRISSGASAVAKHPEVRNALLGIQRHIGKSGKIVLEGRDIGTAVFPNAKHKFFITASPEIRAQRRYLELRAKGQNVTLKEVLGDQEARDLADSSRTFAPLKQAQDAVLIECDNMSIEEVVREILCIMELKCS